MFTKKNKNHKKTSKKGEKDIFYVRLFILEKLQMYLLSISIL